MNILITGMSGLIGRALASALEHEHTLTAFNRSSLPGARAFAADLSDQAALARAVEGQDVVVHLAAKAGEDYSWEELRNTNIEGTRNVFHAATEAGVPRVVFASSGATVAGVESDEPYKSLVAGDYTSLPGNWPMITVNMPTRPRGIYGSTKVWGEALAQHYADSTNTTFISVRIGDVNEQDAPQNPRQASVWCSQRDVTQALTLAATADLDMSYGVFFAGSNNRYGYRDLSHGEHLLGYKAQDGA